MRIIAFCFYTGIVFAIGVFSKDDIKYLVNNAISNNTTLRNIDVVFSPNQGATKAIINMLARAKKSILVSAYSFTSQEIASALLDAKKRGVDVKLILDKSQITQRYSSSTFFANQGFDLKIDIKHAIFHNKYMIIDDHTVITGSFNFTKAAETKNAENILIIRDNFSIASKYTQNWKSHWDNSIYREEYIRKNN